MIILGLLCFLQEATGQQQTQLPEHPVKTLAHDIGVDAGYQNGNWEAVLTAVQGKRIVLLGELNHGSKEIFITRNELIKKLHQDLGFEVILFESGLGEVGALDLKKDSLTGEQLTTGFFGGWRTREFRDLMEYVQENKLSVGGFDVQKTGGAFNTLLEEQARLLKLEAGSYDQLESRFNQQKNLLSDRKAVYDSLRPSTEALLRDYQILSDQINVKAGKNNTQATLIVRRTLENRIFYLHYFLSFTQTKNWHKRWQDRDSMMASNVEWLIHNLYENKKIIIVAHNYHIARFNEKEAVMGEFLLQPFGAETYALGVFAGDGSFADNAGKIKQMGPVETEAADIREVIQLLENKVHFLAIPKVQTDENAFLFGETTINDTFIDLTGTNKLRLNKHFDGLLLIDKISPP